MIGSAKFAQTVISAWMFHTFNRSYTNEQRYAHFRSGVLWW